MKVGVGVNISGTGNKFGGGNGVCKKGVDIGLGHLVGDANGNAAGLMGGLDGWDNAIIKHSADDIGIPILIVIITRKSGKKDE